MCKTFIAGILILSVLTLSSCCHKGTCSKTDDASEASIQDAKAAIGAIHHACRFHENDLSKSPESVEELIRKEYLALDEETASQWSFSFQHAGDKVTKIFAKSTDKMPGGVGYEVTLDRESGKFSIVKP